jgi:hypothetical protein
VRTPRVSYDSRARGSTEPFTSVAPPSGIVSPRGANRGPVQRARRVGALARFGLTAPLLSAALLVAAPASHASAASCYGRGCNNLDPYHTGCAHGAYEVTRVGRLLRDPWEGTNGSVVHLFWSPTCQTNWTVVTQPQGCYDAEGTAVIANVTNSWTGDTAYYRYQSHYAPPYVWGNMIYAPDRLRVTARSTATAPMTPRATRQSPGDET